MRYMMLVRSVAPAGPPPSAFLEAMGKLSAEGTSPNPRQSSLNSADSLDSVLLRRKCGRIPIFWHSQPWRV
jgi:hypothetical protein